MDRTPFRYRHFDFRREEDWIEAFRERLAGAVGRTLSAEDRHAVMLSGGLDSGPIAAVASRLLGEHGKLEAVSWKLPRFPDCDESNHIAAVAQQAGIEVELYDASDRLPFSRLEGNPEFPFYGAFQDLVEGCYERARARGCRIILNGGTGDQLYPHPDWLILDLLQRREWREAAALIRGWRKSKRNWTILHYPALRYAVRRLLRRSPRQATRPQPWLQDNASGELARIPAWPPEANEHPNPQYARQLLGTGLGFSSSVESGNAERFGLQRRDPFLDASLVELMLAMPFSMSHHNGESKWIMREAMRKEPCFPARGRTKPRTGLLHAFYDAGFWHNRDRLEDLLMRERREWQEWVKPEPVAAAFDRDRSTQRNRVLASTCLGYVLWREEIRKLRSGH